MLWKRLRLVDWIGTHIPDWAHETIRSWDQAIEPACGVFALQFLLRTRRANRSIDVRQIVGQQVHYAGQTWLSTVDPSQRSGKMRECLERVDVDPWYYFTPAERHHLSLVSFNGAEWYSNTGVHRAIVAKFLHAYYQAETGFHPLLHNVPTVQHFVDQDTLDQYLKLDRLVHELKLPITMSVKSGPRMADASIEAEEMFEAPRIYVTDRRLSEGSVHQSRVLTAKAFRVYASWVCATAGEVSRKDRVRYVLGRALSPNYDAFSLAIGNDCARET